VNAAAPDSSGWLHDLSITLNKIGAAQRAERRRGRAGIVPQRLVAVERAANIDVNNPELAARPRGPLAIVGGPRASQRYADIEC
jgi:hypothetical protein